MSEAGASEDADKEPLAVRVTKLEQQIEQVYRPAVTEKIPELREVVREQSDEIDDLREELEELEQKLDRRIGVADENSSTHEKRVQDVYEILLRRAEANDDDMASMYTGEIGESLVDQNHGELSHTQLSRIITDLAEYEGFCESKGKRDVANTDDRSDIREVKVIQCTLDSVPGSAPANNVVGGGDHDGVGQDASESETGNNTTTR